MSITRIQTHFLAVALSLCSTLVLAAPAGQSGRTEDRQSQQAQGQEQHQAKQQPQQRASQSAQKQQPGIDSRNDKQQAEPGKSSNRPQPSQPNRSGPPSNLSHVEKELRDYRSEIGRGSPVPAHVKIIKGKPLPPGYGKRLPPATLAHLPRYNGYEWRRVGSDMVLVAITTGIVYALFAGVLN
jgi:Ni/Co efflux regulator RcnB